MEAGQGITVEASQDLELKGMGVKTEAQGDVELSGTNIEIAANAQFKASGSAGSEVSTTAVLTLQGTMLNIN